MMAKQLPGSISLEKIPLKCRTAGGEELTAPAGLGRPLEPGARSVSHLLMFSLRACWPPKTVRVCTSSSSDEEVLSFHLAGCF